MFLEQLPLYLLQCYSRGVRKLFHKYWDYLGFVTNSLLFFLIGILLLTLESYESVGLPGRVRGGIAVALVLSLSSAYEYENLFISLIIPLIAINLVVNPILLGQYLKKSAITQT